MKMSSNSHVTKSWADRVEDIPLSKRPEEAEKRTNIYLAAAAAVLGASGPASAPSGTPPVEVADSPTWWKSSDIKGIN